MQQAATAAVKALDEKFHAACPCGLEQVSLDSDTLAYALKGHLGRLSAAFEQTPTDPGLLSYFVEVARLAHDLPFEVNLWKTQDVYFRMLGAVGEEVWSRANAGDQAAQEWVGQVQALGQHLGFNVKARQHSC
ncbi:MAG: hypothetical protein L0Z50_15905 [Verrucomicrobiales bacterium]|nr:hypothetical protein [Verrucomicrobiales bacterium]